MGGKEAIGWGDNPMMEVFQISSSLQLLLDLLRDAVTVP
ncbi:hypothetical protein CKA32_002286 [Geitlerinema sp. FC II]|nr:hypothetical protein CKA32_002286 [Geitlerinema sp. FC II]